MQKIALVKHRCTGLLSIKISFLDQFFSNGNVGVVELLLKSGADIHAKDYYGLTPLHWAAELGYTEVVALLLKHGANINARNNFGVTPLHRAANHGQTKVLELLLQHGADTEGKTCYSYFKIGTLLHWAAWHRKAAVVELLLKHGSDINAKVSMAKPRYKLLSQKIIKKLFNY